MSLCGVWLASAPVIVRPPTVRAIWSARPAASGSSITTAPPLRTSRLFEPARVAGTHPHHLRIALRPVHDGGGLGPAVAGVDHRVQQVAELLPDLPAIGHRLWLPGQQQGAGQERLAKRADQGCGDRVLDAVVDAGDCGTEPT